jgi:hypothetical protein
MLLKSVNLVPVINILLKQNTQNYKLEILKMN